MKKTLKLFVFVSLILISSLSKAQPLGWTYTQPITITNTSGSLVTEYQVKISLNTSIPISASQMLIDGADIRFAENCDGTNNLNFWIESGINTSSTFIWVKLDTLPASGSKTIYLFYGNSSAPSASAIPGTFIGPHSATDSVSTGGAGGATNSQRGFRFSPNEDLLVTSFGKREPNGSSRYVTLFDFSTQAIISQTQVAGPAAQYNYSSLTNPLWLTSGTQYVLELYQGATDGYYFGSSSQIGQHLTYLDMRYCNSCTQNTFPVSTLSNYHYGYPDLWYYTKKNIASLPTISYDPPQNLSIPSFTSAVVCNGENATISASGVGTISWYNAASGGTYLGSGNNFTTGNLLSDTLFYAQDSTNCGVSPRATVNVTVNPTSSSIDVQTACGSYQWIDGNTYTSSNNTASFLLSNSFGCDSIVTLNLTLLNTSSSTDTQTACDFYQWIDGTTYTTNNNSATVVLTNSVGCDSIITLNLTMLNSTASTDTQTACGSYQWVDGNTYTSNNNSATVVFTNAAGCDSTVTLNLTINTVDVSTSTSSTTITANAISANYQWLDCNNGNISIAGATNQNFTASANGDYAVLVTQGLCSDTSACVSITSVGIEEFTSPELISIIPNPSSGTFVVQTFHEGFYSLVNELGQLIQSFKTEKDKALSVTVSGLKSGVYFIINTDNQVVKKVVVTN
jgi:Ig-like domain CHU_C associated/Domain of unknown function (DUF2341)/Secretion system C-terminal sorting domain